jgi:hypothetical protein
MRPGGASAVVMNRVASCVGVCTGDQIMELLGWLYDLRRIDLSHNMLNGVLSTACANLANLAEINLDSKCSRPMPRHGATSSRALRTVLMLRRLCAIAPQTTS